MVGNSRERLGAGKPVQKIQPFSIYKIYIYLLIVFYHTIIEIQSNIHIYNNIKAIKPKVK